MIMIEFYRLPDKAETLDSIQNSPSDLLARSGDPSADGAAKLKIDARGLKSPCRDHRRILILHIGSYIWKYPGISIEISTEKWSRNILPSGRGRPLQPRKSAIFENAAHRERPGRLPLSSALYHPAAVNTKDRLFCARCKVPRCIGNSPAVLSGPYGRPRTQHHFEEGASGQLTLGIC